MTNLKKLVCSSISDEAHGAYEGLADNNEEDRDESHFINTSFELEIKSFVLNNSHRLEELFDQL